MGDFLAFRKMITPVVIQILFWIGVLVCVLIGVGLLTGSSSFGYATPVSPKLAGIVVLIFGPLLVRFYCELMIVLFRIFDSLRVIERNTAKGDLP